MTFGRGKQNAGARGNRRRRAIGPGIEPWYSVGSSSPRREATVARKASTVRPARYFGHKNISRRNNSAPSVPSPLPLTRSQSLVPVVRSALHLRGARRVLRHPAHLLGRRQERGEVWPAVVGRRDPRGDRGGSPRPEHRAQTGCADDGRRVRARAHGARGGRRSRPRVALAGRRARRPGAGPRAGAPWRPGRQAGLRHERQGVPGGGRTASMPTSSGHIAQGASGHAACSARRPGTSSSPPPSWTTSQPLAFACELEGSEVLDRLVALLEPSRRHDTRTFSVLVGYAAPDRVVDLLGKRARSSKRAEEAIVEGVLLGAVFESRVRHDGHHGSPPEQPPAGRARSRTRFSITLLHAARLARR